MKIDDVIVGVIVSILIICAVAIFVEKLNQTRNREIFKNRRIILSNLNRLQGHRREIPISIENIKKVATHLDSIRESEKRLVYPDLPSLEEDTKRDIVKRLKECIDFYVSAGVPSYRIESDVDISYSERYDR